MFLNGKRPSGIEISLFIYRLLLILIMLCIWVVFMSGCSCEKILTSKPINVKPASIHTQTNVTTTTTTQTTKPSGEVTTTTTTQVDKTEIKPPRKFKATLGVSNRFDDPLNFTPNYSLMIERRVWESVWFGVSGNTKSEIGVSVGVEF
jgi:hypothetical protein